MEIKKKKIAILTFHYSCSNYGAVIQPYALSHVLNKIGFEVTILNYILPSSFNGKIVDFLFGKSFDNFRKTFLTNISHRIRSELDFYLLNNIFDFFIVGSDQVWRYKYVALNYKHYFLDFVEDDAKKISYAASFGKDNWDEANCEATSLISVLLSKFKNVSVREDSGVHICQDIFNIDAKLVLDPTLLCDQNAYDKILNKVPICTDKIISFYILDKNKQSNNVINYISNYLNIKAVNMHGNEFTIIKKRFIFYNSVPKWLALLRDSELIITDSFHCVALSIIFKKNFFCILNKNRGIARIKSLLKILGLENRLISDDFNKISYESINYSTVYEILNLHRKKSRDFLTKSLLIQIDSPTHNT